MRSNPACRLPLRGHTALAIGLLLGVWACSGTSSSQSVAQVAVHTTCAPSGGALVIHVCGNRLVDGKDSTVQLRGVSVAGLEGVAVAGWQPDNPWGGNTGTPTPDWELMKTWGVNTVRIPLNEASWLGATCADMGGSGVHFVGGTKTQNAPGEMVAADPGHNYRETVGTAVSQATQAGLYVILDLHWSAPGNACPTGQNAMADADHSLTFWTAVATTFKGSPNVIFELFNEPFLDQAPLQDSTPLEALRDGKGTIASYNVQGKPGTIKYPWHPVGMQQMLVAVRATGATNVVLTSTPAYSSAIDGWLQSRPTDTLNPSQIAAVWHSYPAGGFPMQTGCIGLPSCSDRIMEAATAIQAAGYPVVITEFGDKVGGSAAPFASMLLPFADKNGISYLAWTWDNWIGTDFYLISDGAGHPTAGYGTYVKQHYHCRTTGAANCL